MTRMFLKKGSVAVRGKVCAALFANQTVYSSDIKLCQKCICWNF